MLNVINERNEPTKVFAELLQLLLNVERLRSPTDGCLWFNRQTFQTSRRYLLEEVYEVLDAIDSESPEKLLEELGDLLFQVIIQTQLASEQSWFSLIDVLEHINRKIVRRTPHVFGDRQANTFEEAQQIWKEIKATEKTGHKYETHPLDGLSTAMPALALSQAYLERTPNSNIGFGITHPELLREIEARLGSDSENTEIELGKLLFFLVDFARRHNLDAEAALRKTNSHFRQHATEQARSLNKESRA